LNKLYKSIFTDNASYNAQTANYLSKNEIIDELMMPFENETFKKYLQEASFLDMLLDLIFEQLNEIIETKLKFYTKICKQTTCQSLVVQSKGIKINERQFPFNETS
jgi:hypothetical protein